MSHLVWELANGVMSSRCSEQYYDAESEWVVEMGLGEESSESDWESEVVGSSTDSEVDGRMLDRQVSFL